jgi:DNA-binding transcriptional LysR family regulator
MLALESLNGVITFVVAARCTSFTEAAELLGVSKSAVGKSIARLESRLGVKLFHRTTRQVTLTADGDAYLEVCATALEQIAEAESSLGSRLGEPAGRLRVDMPAAFGRKIVTPVLLEIAKNHSALLLTLSYSDDVVNLLDEHIDLAVRFGAVENSGELVARKLTSHRWIICAAPEYLKSHGTPERPSDIAEHRCIIGHRRGQPLSWRLADDGMPIRFTPPSTYQFSDGEAMIDAAVAGMGLCQMPDALFKPLIRKGKLVQVLDAYTSIEIDVHAVWPKSVALRPKVRYVIDKLVELGNAGAFN